jgi:UDP-glucose 4-epimerase
MQTRDFISVDDVVDAIVLSATLMEDSEDKPEILSPIFNIGTGIPTSISELAKKMIKIFGLDLQPAYKETKGDEKEISESYADITRAKKTLSFVAKKSIETGLKELIQPIVLRKNSL